MQNWQAMAADRLTQLQDAVNVQAENFCNSIGILQQIASGSQFPEFDKNSPGNNVSGNSKSPSNSSGSTATNKENKSSKCSTVTGSNMVNGTSSSTLASSLNKRSSHDKDGDSQDLVNSLASQCASREDYGQVFARMIARTAKDIDILIDSLPPTNENEMSSSEVFSTAIPKLLVENAETASELQEIVGFSEFMLQFIQSALEEIADTQLRNDDGECIEIIN